MSWRDWSKRFQEHLSLHNLTQDAVGEAMVRQVSQGAVGHWLNGRRKINLEDFFDLCAAAGADPARILFGGDMAHLVETQIKQVFASQPQANPRYGAFEKRLRNSPRRSKRVKRKTPATRAEKKSGRNRPASPPQ